MAAAIATTGPGVRSTILSSFASTFGGPAFLGFSDSVGMCDTPHQVIEIANPLGA